MRRNVNLFLIFQKILIKSFGTFLYVPSLTIFLNVFRCQIVDGKMMFRVVENLECWTGSHLAFAVCSSFGIIFLIFLGINYATFTNEINSKSGNIFAKYSIKIDFINLLARTCIGVTFLFNDSQLYITFSIIFILFSIFQFYSFKKENPYYSEFISRIRESMILLQIWAGICLLIGMILNEVSTISIFLIGVFFVYFMAIFLVKTKRSQLLETEDFLNMNNVNEKEVIKQISIFQTEISEGKLNRGLFFSFTGYMIKHVKFCTNKECSVCKEEHIQGFITSFVKKNEYGNANEINKCLNEIFCQTMEVYPHFRTVKLIYLHFLIENMQNSNRAFSFAQKMYLDPDLNISEQFELFKNMKKMSNIARDQALKMKDAVIIRKQIEFSKFRRRIFEATEFYSKFWLSLNCQEPVESDIEITASQILRIKEKIRAQIKSFELNGYRNIELTYLYAEFVGNVLGDFGNSHRLKLECLQSMSSSAFNVENTDQISSLQSKSILDVFADGKRLGIVRDCNMGFCQWYGAQKQRIVGMKIESFIPRCLQKKHSDMIVSVSSQDRPRGRSLFVLMLNVSGYLSPMEMQVIYLHEVSGETHIFCSMWQRKIHNKMPGYILFDSNFVLQNVSAYGVTLLGLDQKVISSTRIELRNVFPTLSIETAKENTRKKILVNYVIHSSAFEYFRKHNPHRFIQIKSSKAIHFSIVIYEIKFGNEIQASAYYFSIRDESSNVRAETDMIISAEEMNRQIPPSETQFLYYEKFGNYVRDFFPSSVSLRGKFLWVDSLAKQVGSSKNVDTISTSSNLQEEMYPIIENFLQKYENLGPATFSLWFGPKILTIYDALQKRGKFELELLLKQKFFQRHIPLIETVVTKRINYHNNPSEFIPVHSIPGIAENTRNLMYLQEEEFSHKKTRKKNSVMDQDYRAHQALLSDEDLLSQIYEKSNEKKYFIYFFFYFLVIIITYTGVGYIFVSQVFNDVDLINISGEKSIQSSRRFSEVMDFQTSLLILISINEGKITQFRQRTKDQYIEFLRFRMLKVFEAVSNDTTDQFTDLTKMSIEHFEMYRKSNIIFYGMRGKVFNVNFQDLVFSLLSFFLKILDMNTTQIVEGNDIVYLIMEDNQLVLQNVLLNDSQLSIKLIELSIIKTDESLKEFGIVIYSIVLLLPLGIIVGYIWFRRERNKLLDLFLSVSSLEIQEQIEVTQSALYSLLVNQAADIDVEELDKEGKLMEQKTWDVKERKSKPRSFRLNYHEIIMVILLALLITIWISFGTTIYLIFSKNMIQEFKKASAEISTTGITMGLIGTVYFRLLLSYKDNSYVNYTNAQSTFNNVKNCVADWELSHETSDSKQFKDYNKKYDEITKSNLCSYLPLTGYVYEEEEIASCNSSMAGIGGIGLFPVMTFIIDSIREYFEKFGGVYEKYTTFTEREKVYTSILNEYAFLDIFQYINQLAKPIYFYLNKQILGIFEENEEYWKVWVNYVQLIEICSMIFLTIFISFIIKREYIKYKKYLESISVIPVRIRLSNRVLIDYVKKRLK